MSATRHARFPLVVLSVLVACGGPEPRTAADSQAAHVQEVVAAGGVVDSILPIAEQLRRFRVGVSGQPDTLSSASESLDALVARWALAISNNDSVALGAMILNMAEFAWLYYPESKMSKPPYESPPALLWWQFVKSSSEGERGARKRYGGKPFRVRGIDCRRPLLIEGANRLHEECVLAFSSAGGKTQTGRLFGTIIEREGRFKFIGLSNSL